MSLVSTGYGIATRRPCATRRSNGRSSAGPQSQQYSSPAAASRSSVWGVSTSAGPSHPRGRTPVAAAGWEMMPHGVVQRTMATVEDERAVIDESIAEIAAAVRATISGYSRQIAELMLSVAHAPR